MDETKNEVTKESIEKRVVSYLLKKQATNFEIMFQLGTGMFFAMYIGYILGKCGPLFVPFVP